MRGGGGEKDTGGGGREAEGGAREVERGGGGEREKGGGGSGGRQWASGRTTQGCRVAGGETSRRGGEGMGVGEPAWQVMADRLAGGRERRCSLVGRRRSQGGGRHASEVDPRRQGAAA